MITTKWIGPPPKCKTCKKEMKEWNFFADEHEHDECLTDRVSDRLLEAFTKTKPSKNEGLVRHCGVRRYDSSSTTECNKYLVKILKTEQS